MSMKLVKEYIRNTFAGIFAALRSLYCNILHIKHLHSNVPFMLSPGYSFVIVSETKWAFDDFALADRIRSYAEMKSFLKAAQVKNTLLDIGALFGVFSLAFTCNDSSKSAFAIEPGPYQFSVLKRHARINKGDIKPFKIAFGDNEGFIQMRHNVTHLQAVGKDEDLTESFRIKTTTLDRFVIQNKIMPDIIKIDVEGYELHVLKGGEKFLKSSDPVIFFEIHTLFLKAHGINAGHIEQLIRPLGYAIYDLNYNRIDDLLKYSGNQPATYNVIFKKDVKKL